MSTKPIWIVDHDIEDHDIVKVIWQELGLTNDLVLLNNAEDAFQRLSAAPEAP